MHEVYTDLYADDDYTDETLGLECDYEKPNNAWFQYRTDPSVKKRHHSQPGPHQESQIVKDMALEWRSLSDAEKLPYEQKASHAAYEYKKKLQRQRPKDNERLDAPGYDVASDFRAIAELIPSSPQAVVRHHQRCFTDCLPISDFRATENQLQYAYASCFSTANGPMNCIYHSGQEPRSMWEQEAVPPYTVSSSMNHYLIPNFQNFQTSPDLIRQTGEDFSSAYL